MPKALIFYTAHTIGHKKIAENIAYWLRQLGWQVEMRDAFALASNSGSLAGFLKLHSFVNAHAPFIWRWLYKWGYIFFRPFFGLAAKRYLPYILKELKAVNPDMVVTTQISPSSVLDVIKTKGQWRGVWAIAFSDYHFHPAWAKSAADAYIVNIEEQREALVKRGVKKTHVTVGGMWLPPRPVVNAASTLTKFGLDARSKVVLVGAGSGGWVKFEKALSAVDGVVKLARQSNIVVVPAVLCGKNRTLYTSLEPLQARGWKILFWHDDMAELYAISDIFLTKPGGNSIAEALQWRLPCFTPFFLPGQEELNLRYLSRQKLIVDLTVQSEDMWPTLIWEEITSQDFRRHLASSSEVIAQVTGENSAARLAAFQNGLFHESRFQV